MSSRLQTEIKQNKPFPKLGHEALLGLLRTAAVVGHANEEELRRFGITTTQYNVLRILRGAGEDGLCGREVGERMITKVPDVPRLLDRLEKAGLIGRVRDAADRRHVTATITQRGLDLLQVIADAGDSPLERRFSAIPEDQLRVFIDVLDAIRSG